MCPAAPRVSTAQHYVNTMQHLSQLLRRQSVSRDRSSAMSCENRHFRLVVCLDGPGTRDVAGGVETVFAAVNNKGT